MRRSACSFPPAFDTARAYEELPAYNPERMKLQSKPSWTPFPISTIIVSRTGVGPWTLGLGYEASVSSSTMRYFSSALRIGARQSIVGASGGIAEGEVIAAPLVPFSQQSSRLAGSPRLASREPSFRLELRALALLPRLPAPTRARASSVPAASLFGIRRSSATPGRDRDR